MPRRPLTVAIVAFWLATTAWMLYREVLPRLQSAGPPPFAIDLTDEVSVADENRPGEDISRFGARSIPWVVLSRGEKVGTAQSKVLRHANRTYELRVDLFPAPQHHIVPFISLDRLTSSYRVTGEGDLLGLTIEGVIKDVPGLAKNQQLDLAIEGEVVAGMLVSRVLLYDKVQKDNRQVIDKKELPIKLQELPVAQRGAVLNTLQPVNRLAGLRAGLKWKVPRLDPVETLMAALGRAGPPQTRYLYAEVHPDALPWNGASVPCWRIDYAPPGEPVQARTWVRQADGVVLQQEARNGSLDLVLQRDPRF